MNFFQIISLVGFLSPFPYAQIFPPMFLFCWIIEHNIFCSNYKPRGILIKAFHMCTYFNQCFFISYNNAEIEFF